MESRVRGLQPGLVWDKQACIPWVTHRALWILDLGIGRVAWSLGNPGYSNSKIPSNLSSSFLKWVERSARGQICLPWMHWIRTAS